LAADSVVEIRRVRAGEGTRLRELRLRALADSPNALYSSLDDEATRPLTEWERDVAALAVGRGGAMFVAVERDEWVGMAGAFSHPERQDTMKAWAGWVDPRARSRGLGRALVEAVADWARAAGALHLEVAVAENNDRALAFCRRAGFTPTGEVKPVPWDGTVSGIFMELALTSDEAVPIQRSHAWKTREARTIW
jgi:GNAT superfamily N-acetyltransferase